jgi:6-phosphogluconolactonase (cycloisomerase 2 family)
MPYYMYVALQEDNTIAVLTIDPHTGTLTPQGEVSVPDPPGPAVSVCGMP